MGVRQTILCLLVLITTSGCTLLAKQSPKAQSARAVTKHEGVVTSGSGGTAIAKDLSSGLQIDLFAARGFLEGSDYERYVLKGNTLWRECGGVLQSGRKGMRQAAPSQSSVSGARQGGKSNQVFRDDPNLAAVESRVEQLDQPKLDELVDYSREILELNEKQRLGLPLPGSVFSLTQPGVFELGVRTKSAETRIVTSVDAVADRESRMQATERAHRLFRALRSIGPVICKSRTFFGVGREGPIKE